MQITFYDKNMIETATADNQLLNAIKIKKASLSSYFEEATHYVEFEFSKETGEWWGIKENGYLAFRFRGKFYRFNIVKFKEDVKTNSISILGDYFNLEMLNENCLAYEKQPSRTIVQHLVAMEILPYANFEIGVNELASSSRVVEYTGEEMKYKRLISLINNFDGECQFEIRQKRNGEFDKLILNIYKANDGEKIQGVGRNRRDLELNIDNTNNISRSVDSTTIRTAIEPTGKDGLRLGNSGKTWRNNDGRVEFEQKDGRIYAVIAAEETTRVLSNDKWLVWKQNFDTDSLDKLESESYKWIKNNCYAKETIEVAGSFDVEIGDTVILNHKGVGRYGLLGTLRVVKIVWDLLTEENEVSFANFKRLSSKISAQGLALQESIETPASYDITFNTTAGQVFKNNTGASIVSFNFKKNGLDAAVIGQRWYNGTQLLSNGLEVTIKPDMLTDGKLNLRLEVDVTDAITFSKELTFINVSDGEKGNGIESGKVTYGKTTSISTQPVNWSDSRPAVGQGEVLWSKTTLSYTDKNVPDTIDIKYTYQGKDGALDEEQYNAIVAKNVSQDELISQVKSTADAAKDTASVALSNIVSESKKLTDQMSALSKTEGEHYSATSQQLTQIDGTVKGLQTDYTALVNKDNEITQTLTNYKQTIDQNTAHIAENKQSVDGTISSLQTQVTQNKNDIATKASQLTVNNLSGRMSSAETTITQNANEISTRLSQTNIESLITSKATVITDNKVKETSDSFSREITRVEGLVDGIFSGNRNLLVNTKSMDNIPYTSANKTSETYMGGSVVSALGQSGSYKDAFRQKMSIVPDELEYIVSFYAKSTAVSHNVTCYFYAPNTTIKSVSSQGVVNDRPTGSDGSINISLTNEWKRYWIKWTLRAPKDDTEKIPKEVIVGRNWDSVNSVSIALPALYAGNLNTEWSQAPEDLKAVTDGLTIKYNTVKDTVDSHTQQIGQQGISLTTTIQRVDSIQSSVSSIDGRLSTVTQTADGLVTTVQNLSVGGNNLLLNADFELLENKTSFTVGGVTYSQGPKYWSTYNGGIPNPVTSFHSYSGSFAGRNNVVIFNESDGSRNWKAINQSIGKTIMSDFPDSTDDFILSFDAYADLSGAKLFGGFYYVNKLTGTANFHAGQFTVNLITSGSWNRYSVKVPFNKDNCDFSKTFSFLIYGYGFSSNAILALDNVKLETGTISSAFSKSKKELDDQISSIQTTVTQTSNSWAVKNLTSNGSILSQINLTDGTVKIDGKYVKITGQTLIDNGIITNAMIKDLTADKIIGGTIDANKISVINLNASNITSGQISGGLIKGGVLTALNGAMSIDLNNGTTEMYNDNPAIRRVTADLPNQFIKFSTGTQPNDNNYRIIGSGTKSNLTAAITSIGTNRLRTENNLDGGFTGINIYAGGSGTGDSVVDRIEISSDILKIAHSANSSDRGWVFENINGLNNQYVFRPNTTYQDTYKAMIGTSLNPVDEMYINEMYIKGQRLGYILKDIANRIGNVGSWAAVIS